MAVGVFGVWLLVTGAWTLRLADTAKDDFFITYTYARNLAAGRGLVFNPGEHVFGLSEPGLALALAALHGLTGVSIPWIGTLSTALGLLATVALLTREARTVRRLPEALAGGTLVLSASLLWSNNGGAWPLVVALLTLAGTLARDRPIFAGLGAGLAVWFRPDAGLGVAGLAVLRWVKSRRPPWRLAASSGAVIVLGLLLAWLSFGRLLPGTFGAKLAMVEGDPASWAGPARFWARLLPLLPRHVGEGWPWLAALAVPGLLTWARRGGESAQTLLLFAGSLTVFYSVTGLPFFLWYLAPCLLVAFYGVAFGAGLAARAALRLPARPALRFGLAAAVPAAAASLVALSALPASFGWWRDYSGYPHQQTYREAARWIAAHTPPSDSIAYVEIGEVGYWSERRVRDLLGLVSPEVLPYVRANDLAGAFLLEPTELVLFHTRGRMGPIVSAPWFHPAYEEIAAFSDRTPPGVAPRRLIIFRRRIGSSLPSPLPPGRQRAGSGD